MSSWSIGNRPALAGWLFLSFIYLSLPLTWARVEGADEGRLEVRVKDHREAIEDFSRLEISLDKIRIKPKVGLRFWRLGWQELKPTVERVELTRVRGRKSATVFSGALAAGSFEAIDLRLKGITAMLKQTGGKADVDGALQPIALPFSVEPQRTTVIVLDLAVMDMRDHPPRGYELQLKGYELHRDGRLLDRVPPG